MLFELNILLNLSLALQAQKMAKQGYKDAKSGLLDVKDELKPFMKNMKETLREKWKGKVKAVASPSDKRHAQCYAQKY